MSTSKHCECLHDGNVSLGLLGVRWGKQICHLSYIPLRLETLFVSVEEDRTMLTEETGACSEMGAEVGLRWLESGVVDMLYGIEYVGLG